MLFGLIKWYDQVKGYGVISTSGKGDYFMHKNDFIGSTNKLTQGIAIIFEQSKNNNKKLNSAIKCKVPTIQNDFKLTMKSIAPNEAITIIEEIQSKGYKGRAYTSKQEANINLRISVITQLFRNSTTEQIQTCVLDYFKAELDIKDYVPYCELIEQAITFSIQNEKDKLLNEIFQQFGKKLNDVVLFDVWKIRKFRYIGYVDKDDYEIPVTVLNKFSDKLGFDELNRVKEFSFGKEFCNAIAIEIIKNSKKDTVQELKRVYPFQEFLTSENGESLRQQLTFAFVKAYTEQINNYGSTIIEIQTKEEIEEINKLKQTIGNELDEGTKASLHSQIDNIIFTKCSSHFKVTFWFRGILDDIPFELIENEFIRDDIKSKIFILKKLLLNDQIKLLKLYKEANSSEQVFEIIEKYITSENSLYNFELSKSIFDPEFMKDKIGHDLLVEFNNYLLQTASDEEKFNLYLKGYFPHLDFQTVLNNATILTEDQSRQILAQYPNESNFIYDFLMAQASSAEPGQFDWAYDLARKLLNERFKEFDKKIFSIKTPSDYFALWENKKGDIFPAAYVSSILNEQYSDYSKIDRWIAKGIVTQEQIATFLISNLNNREVISDRIIFNKKYNHIKYLIELDTQYAIAIENLNNDFYSVILWLLGFTNNFSFDLLATKFIYFIPSEQAKIVKKLFSLIAKGLLDLTIVDLQRLTRVDLDLYKIINKSSPDIPIDISTDIILNALKSYSETKRFLIEGELLALAIRNININKSIRFELKNYFEKCRGRTETKYNWETHGSIKKQFYKNEQGIDTFYYSISFSTHTTEKVRTRNGWGDREVFNQDFNFLKEEVKKLPGRKWNAERQHWGVPAQYENAVFEFAKNNKFFIDIEGSNYANNPHLANFKVSDVPNGITFCEGRLANKLHETFKKEFWWCANQACFQKCETFHLEDNWESYTLLDFCEILGLNTDETNRMGDFIPKGHYYQFIGLINRFNRLLKKIYCEECNQILYPVDHSHFAAYSVVRFHCENDKCGQHHKEIYLNHCLNGQCNTIIDSRISKRCSNGLFICDNCGSCCSHSMLQRRLSNLQTTGGFIHQDLVNAVNQKLGHLERAEYFCFKCKDSMKEVSKDVFVCANCNVQYDTGKYKFKRPHRHMRKADNGD